LQVFLISRDKVNCYIVENKNNWITDYPSASTAEPVKIDTNLFNQEVLTLEYVGFQL
jgi:hypothetical protein